MFTLGSDFYWAGPVHVFILWFSHLGCYLIIEEEEEEFQRPKRTRAVLAME